MQIALFAKKIVGNDGKLFYRYLSTLTKKTGEEIKVSVRFRQECGNPKGEDCPMYIIVPKDKANLAMERYTKTVEDPDSGEPIITENIGYKLWVSEWKKGPEYKDTSLDEFSD